jgi:hypothetical protein
MCACQQHHANNEDGAGPHLAQNTRRLSLGELGCCCGLVWAQDLHTFVKTCQRQLIYKCGVQKGDHVRSIARLAPGQPVLCWCYAGAIYEVTSQKLSNVCCKCKKATVDHRDLHFMHRFAT